MSDIAAQSIALSLGLSAVVSVGCRKLRIPALLPLLGVGLAVGVTGMGVVDGSSLGSALTGFINVAIGLLIFEGALHLNREELSRAPRAVWGLLTIGAIITWAGSAAAAHYVLGMSIPISLLLGASLIVTGPTVVQPILRLVRVSPRIQTALSAEAVLIDPIGVVATITTLEVLRLYFQGGSQSMLAGEGLQLFLKPLLGGAGVGLLMGVIGRFLLSAVGKSAKPDPQMVNLIAVGMCMTCVGIGEVITPEGGLAAVTICGIIMARAKHLGATELRAFKELLAVMLVGTLFVLLTSRFDANRLGTLTWREAGFVALLLFAVRPVAVMLSTWKSKLSLRERAFASTFAPRGIVALSVAAVATVELTRVLQGIQEGGGESAIFALLQQASIDVARLDLVMFVVIAVTVLYASVVSPLLAWLLRVSAGEGNALFLVGGHSLSLAFAKLLKSKGVHVRIVDSSEERIAKARDAGIEALVGDATDTRWMDDIGAPHDIGWVVAWTGNHDVDQITVRWAADRLGKGRAAIWSTKPARGPLEPFDIYAGGPIGDSIVELEENRLACTEAVSPKSLSKVLGWTKATGFTLNVPLSRVLSAPQDATFLGLSVSAAPEPPTQPAPHAQPRPTSAPLFEEMLAPRAGR